MLDPVLGDGHSERVAASTEQRKHSIIVDARGWVYTGARFVSPFSDEVECAVHFVNGGVARQWAEHLLLIGMTLGIRVTKARHEKGIRRPFKHPPITGMGMPNSWEIGALRRHAREKESKV